ncbi:MAG TPA: DUF1674 domain-containing protein [Rhizomicrobium sp.]|nr:DUF1674 domain-containing protein [Rhizomicrobium sp.]
MADISKTLSPEEIARRIREAGERAKAEAAERRSKEQAATPLPPELGGQKGPEPTRYGDWEKNGIISDF